jgi:hypothetical protein
MLLGLFGMKRWSAIAVVALVTINSRSKFYFPNRELSRHFEKFTDFFGFNHHSPPIYLRLRLRRLPLTFAHEASCLKAL